MLTKKIKIFFFFLILFNLNILRSFLRIIKIEINKLNLYYDYLNYSWLGSNHPRRYHAYSKRFKSIDFWLSKNSDWQLKNKDKSLNFFYLDEVKKKIDNDIDIIFFGDSHVEFLSRILENKESLKPNNVKSYWVGAKTVIGLLSKESREEIIKDIKKILNQTKRKSYIIFSFGGIDIRCSFYEMLFRKISRNEKELLQLFKNGLEVLINEIIIKTKNKNNVIGVGLLGLINSSFTGKEPKSLKSLIAIKKKYLYPTLGYKSKRAKWTIKVNSLIKKMMKRQKIDFIGTNNLLKIKNVDKILLDGIHLSSNKIVNQVSSEIFNNIQKK
tara:strand:- start:3105 stop:4085 length:981 start_codon:yes stop_codon:yes gene_type:complete